MSISATFQAVKINVGQAREKLQMSLFARLLAKDECRYSMGNTKVGTFAKGII
jgi:hypothetical protein